RRPRPAPRPARPTGLRRTRRGCGRAPAPATAPRRPRGWRGSRPARPAGPRRSAVQASARLSSAEGRLASRAGANPELALERFEAPGAVLEDVVHVQDGDLARARLAKLLDGRKQQVAAH